MRASVGSDGVAVCDERRKREPAGVRISRAFAAALRELLGLLQHLLRARAVGLDLCLVWHS